MLKRRISIFFPEMILIRFNWLQLGNYPIRLQLHWKFPVTSVPGSGHWPRGLSSGHQSSEACWCGTDHTWSHTPKLCCLICVVSQHCTKDELTIWPTVNPLSPLLSSSTENLGTADLLVNKRVPSSGSLAVTTPVGYGSIYSNIWKVLVQLGKDPDPSVAQMARRVLDSVKLKVREYISYLILVFDLQLLPPTLKLTHPQTYARGDSAPFLCYVKIC